MRRTRLRSATCVLALALAVSPLLATACKGEEHRAQGSAGAPGSETPEQGIKRLEDEGKLPVLDRSDDIAGTDGDHNGIRDDIDALIAQQDYTEPQRKAVQQLARSLQAAVALNSASLDEARAVGEANNRAVHCVFLSFPNYMDASSACDTYEKVTANTSARVRSYFKYNHALNGTVSASPKGNSCE